MTVAFDESLITPDVIAIICKRMQEENAGKIFYNVSGITYDWLTMCKEWEDPKEWDGGQFCGGIEMFRYRHPILQEKDIVFVMSDDEILQCYSTDPT